MKQWLLQRIKKAFENIESILTTIFFLALFGGSISVLAFSKKAIDYCLQILNRPTPIGATIVLILLVLYDQIKNKNIQINTEKLDSAYGVYWDKKFNMYCLSCKKPLKHSELGTNEFWCSDPKCNSKYALRDTNGLPITQQDAIMAMKK